MNLFLLEARKEKTDMWEIDWDKMLGVVVRAENENRARELAAEHTGDEGPEAWLNPEYSTCEPLEQDGDEEIIIRDVAWA